MWKKLTGLDYAKDDRTVRIIDLERAGKHDDAQKLKNAQTDDMSNALKGHMHAIVQQMLDPSKHGDKAKAFEAFSKDPNHASAAISALTGLIEEDKKKLSSIGAGADEDHWYNPLSYFNGNKRKRVQKEINTAESARSDLQSKDGGNSFFGTVKLMMDDSIVAKLYSTRGLG
jgi:hypothetical protein